MTDIHQLTDILRQFAEYKRQQADEQLSMADGVFREKKYERGRLLQLQAQDLIGYADEIEEWWARR